MNECGFVWFCLFLWAITTDSIENVMVTILVSLSVCLYVKHNAQANKLADEMVSTDLAFCIVPIATIYIYI